MIQETKRLDALIQLNLLDTPPSESFDRITRMASQIFNLPVAAVSLTDSDRQWFKSRVGIDHWSIPRHKAPCAQVAETRELLVIEDMLNDSFYCDSGLAQNGVRFYAGAPLTTVDGFGLGAMCVLGIEPRKATATELGSLTDLASMVMSQIELTHAFGRIDPVSGLPNRTQFIEDLDDLSGDLAGQQRIAVLIDLVATDQLNHAARVIGPTVLDELVKEAARNLRLSLGAGHKAYHVAATQFACMAPSDMDEIEYVAFLRSKDVELRHLTGVRSVSTPAIGVAPFVLGTLASTDVLRMAQSAAQDARASGKALSFYSTEQDSKFQRSYKLLCDFATTIQVPYDLRLVYQPRVELASGRCVGAEALLRWTHPTLGPISPGEFIPMVEKMALAGPTTAWVLDTAVAQVAQWIRADRTLTVSVNISAENLRDPDFADGVRRVLAKHRVPAQSLELEITETAVMEDAKQSLAQLEDLASSGIRLAIDDFGTGYSSLSYLQRLPVQVVKIDQSFIRTLHDDPRSHSLVTMMVSMAKHLGHCVVAEGVETERMLELLRLTGCDEVQGYHLGRPMTVIDFETWLDRQTPPPSAKRRVRRAGAAPALSAIARRERSAAAKV